VHRFVTAVVPARHAPAAPGMNNEALRATGAASAAALSPPRWPGAAPGCHGLHRARHARRL